MKTLGGYEHKIKRILGYRLIWFIIFAALLGLLGRDGGPYNRRVKPPVYVLLREMADRLR